jgi:DNA polymerase III epsilon subunit-like protein
MSGWGVSLLVLDTETGGLNPETDALLSVGLVHWQDGQIVRQQEILVDAEGLQCSPKALEVNGIDLDLHHAYSVSRAEAWAQIQEFGRPISRSFIVGHNVQFDLGFVRRLEPERERRAFGSFGRFSLDTIQIMAFMRHAGLLPPGKGLNLTDAMAHFGITMPAGKRHTALADALATAELYTRLLDTIAGVRA